MVIAFPPSIGRHRALRTEIHALIMAAQARPGETLQVTDARGPSSAALRSELRDLYDDYAACLDDGNLDAWPGFFTEDCVYAVTSHENFSEGLPLAAIYCRGLAMIRDRVAALRAATVYEPRVLRHMVSCVRVKSAEAGLVRSEANFAVFECLSDREPHVLMVGRYVDVVVRHGAALKFQERTCVYDNYRVRTSLVMPV